MWQEVLVAFDAADPGDADPGDATPPPDHALRTAWAAAQAQLQRFTLMSDSVPVQIAHYLHDGLVCTYANRSYAATFGLDATSIVGRTLAEVIGADALRLVQPHIDRMLATRRTVHYTRSMVVTGGAVRWIDVSLVPHGVAVDGTALAGDAMAAVAAAGLPLAGAFVLITDITRFHDAEQALRDSEERLRKFRGRRYDH